MLRGHHHCHNFCGHLLSSTFHIHIPMCPSKGFMIVACFPYVIGLCAAGVFDMSGEQQIDFELLELAVPIELQDGVQEPAPAEMLELPPLLELPAELVELPAAGRNKYGQRSWEAIAHARDRRAVQIADRKRQDADAQKEVMERELDTASALLPGVAELLGRRPQHLGRISRSKLHLLVR